MTKQDAGSPFDNLGTILDSMERADLFTEWVSASGWNRGHWCSTGNQIGTNMVVSSSVLLN